MSKKLDEARRKHEKFLRSVGAHPEQIKQRKRENKKIFITTEINKQKITIEHKKFLEPLENYKDTGKVTGILANIHNEPEHVKIAVKKLKSRVMPLYNKGGLQLASETEDMSLVGNRSRRG